MIFLVAFFLAAPKSLNQSLLERTGGESGIRTHVTLSSKHAFQACAFSHSATSPGKRAFKLRLAEALSIADTLAIEAQRALAVSDSIPD